MWEVNRDGVLLRYIARYLPTWPILAFSISLCPFPLCQSSMYLVSCHFVNIDQEGIDKVQTDKVGRVTI